MAAARSSDRGEGDAGVGARHAAFVVASPSPPAIGRKVAVSPVGLMHNRVPGEDDDGTMYQPSGRTPSADTRSAAVACRRSPSAAKSGADAAAAAEGAAAAGRAAEGMALVQRAGWPSGFKRGAAWAV